MSEPIPPDDETTPKPDPVTEELVAYLDGELDASQAEVMATKLSLNPKLRAEADSLKRAWDVLDMLPKPKPSASFTAKTISQVLPANLVVTIAAEKTPAPATMLAVQPATIAPRFPWILASVLVTFLGLSGGYFGRAILIPKPDDRSRDAEMLDELSLLKNARLYRYVDDMDFLRRLDTPEYFSEDDQP